MSRRNGRRANRRRSRSRTGETNRNTWILGSVVAALGVGGLWFGLSAPAVADLDEATLCPSDPALVPLVHTVLLERNRRLDAETREFAPMDPNTARQIERLLLDELTSLPVHAKVVVYEVSYDGQDLFEPVSVACNPGNGDEVGVLYGNPRMARKRYRDRFLEPLRELFRTRTSWSPDHSFSLWHSLDGVAREFADPALKHAARSLTVVSDFVVPRNFGRSTLSGVPPEWEPTASPDEPQWNTNGFGGAEVRLIYARMKYKFIPDIQGEKHLEWWKRYFTDRDAMVTEVHHVGVGW